MFYGCIESITLLTDTLSTTEESTFTQLTEVESQDPLQHFSFFEEQAMVVTISAATIANLKINFCILFVFYLL
jgi:hypothetical protein